jgi:hypothetical protein
MKKPDEKHTDKLRKGAARRSEQSAKSSGPTAKKMPRSAAARAREMAEKYGPRKVTKPTKITSKQKPEVKSNLRGAKKKED